MQNLAIEYRHPSSLKPAPRNARRHSKRQIRLIAKSIETFGFNTPVLIDGDGVIIAGHGRVEAASLLKMSRVPTVRLDHLTAEQRRAYMLADNRTAELATWDDEMLAVEMAELLAADLSFDIDATGFAMADIDRILGEPNTAEPESPSELEKACKGPPITKPGDLWLLGAHRVLCGDALAAESYDRLLEGEQAQVVFTDPPYNVKIDGNVSSRGKHEEFAMASGEMTDGQFREFLQTAIEQAARASQSGAIHYICMDWRGIDTLVGAAKAAGGELKNICVWTKGGGMGSLYRSAHEMVAVVKFGNAPHINNVELGRFKRNRTNVWAYPGMSSPRGDRKVLLALHPTVKPVALVADALLDCSNRDGIVLDPFGGSGSTLIAAERTARRARLIELSPTFVDVIIRRYRLHTQREPIQSDTGLSLADLEALLVPR